MGDCKRVTFCLIMMHKTLSIKPKMRLTIALGCVSVSVVELAGVRSAKSRLLRLFFTQGACSPVESVGWHVRSWINVSPVSRRGTQPSHLCRTRLEFITSKAN